MMLYNLSATFIQSLVSAVQAEEITLEVVIEIRIIFTLDKFVATNLVNLARGHGPDAYPT